MTLEDADQRSEITELEIETSRDGDTHTIRVSGELDLGNADSLDAALLEGEAGDASRILLDLEQLVFIDSTGLRAILKATRRSNRLRITRGTGYVADMFRLTALDKTLPFA